MILVLSMIAAVWGVGWAMSTPKAARLYMAGAVMAVVVLAHLMLPDGHPWRRATGGSAAFWAMWLGFGAIVLLYARGLAALKRRAQPSKEAPIMTSQRVARFSPDEVARYGRHLSLREIGGQGQRALKEAKVLVIGAGGLGSPVLQYLAGAGVGAITVVDDDVVEATNLQRQIIHSVAFLGQPKVVSAAEAMLAQNPHIKVFARQMRLDVSNAAELVAGQDLVIDCCDSLESRYALNAAAVAAKVPLVSAALTAWEGQITVYDPARGAPCLSCVFPVPPAADLTPSCSVAGVVSPLPGVLGTMMALEAIKVLTGAGETLRGRMMIYDALYAQTRLIRVKPAENCSVCGKAHG